MSAPAAAGIDWCTVPASAWGAVTVKAPWDLCMTAPVADPKRVIDRRWSTDHRGPVLLHVDGWDYCAPADENVRRVWHEAIGRWRPELRIIPASWTWRGTVTAVAELVDCHPSTAGCCRPWGNHSVGLHHLVVADLHLLRETVGPVEGSTAFLWRPAERLVEHVRPLINL